jgi:hypothetical protein
VALYLNLSVNSCAVEIEKEKINKQKKAVDKLENTFIPIGF